MLFERSKGARVPGFTVLSSVLKGSRASALYQRVLD